MKPDSSHEKYPDINAIIKKKEQHRRSLAALPFEKKIEMVFKLQERRKFIKSSRIASNSQNRKTKAGAGTNSDE
jgi:hypothetical protein